MNTILFLILMIWCIYILTKINIPTKKEKSYKKENQDIIKPTYYSYEDYGFDFASDKPKNLKSNEDISNKEDISNLIFEITDLIDNNFHSNLVKEKIITEINFLKNRYTNNEVSVINSLNIILNELKENEKQNMNNLINKSKDNVIKTMKLIKENKF